MYTSILVVPRPALLDEVINPQSDYSKQARYEMKLANAAPELLALLAESQLSIGGDWRARRDAAIARIVLWSVRNSSPAVPPPAATNPNDRA